jgi:hypothetical protein
MGDWLHRMSARAAEPVDARSLRVFRAGFGLILAAQLVRLHLTGWTAPLFLEPTFRFEYPALAFIPAIPSSLVVVVLAVGAASALLLGFSRGWSRRVAGFAFLACFLWLKSFDVTNYLNHDYLAFLLGVLLTVAPLDGATVPRWVLWLFRVQVGVVYVHAGLAKVNTEWLLHGRPLDGWFAANRSLPGLGHVLGVSFAPVIASWAACLYDLTIPFWLSMKRARPFAFVVVLGFHATTHALFDIGIFPFLMTLAATVFFEPSWPERFGLALRGAQVGGVPSPPLAALIAGFVLFQALFPLRSHFISDDVLWDEQGMRWSWKVMLREKNGSISYRVRAAGEVREWHVEPLDLLTPRQANEMSGQPDLIVQLARKIGRDAERRLSRPVEVFVDAMVSLNGRPPARLFRPDVDVLKLGRNDLRPALLPSPRRAQLPALAEAP